MSMPFYVSPEQVMKDKADYARKGIARGRSGVVIQYAGGILFVAPNPSRALHKISEIYDRIAFAAVGRYNEYENLRKAGVHLRRRDRLPVRPARRDRARHRQLVRPDSWARSSPRAASRSRSRSSWPRWGDVDADQIYRITFDGSVADEHGFAAIGGQADQVATALKDRYSADMSLTDALSAALTALSAPASAAGNGTSGNGTEQPEMPAGQLEVAVLDRTRTHRTFRRLAGARLEELLAESRPADSAASSTGTTAGVGPDADAIGPAAPDDGNPTPGTSTDPD